MLSGDGNKNSQKKSVGLIIKKTTFARTVHFLFTFLCHCFAGVLEMQNFTLAHMKGWRYSRTIYQ